MIKVIVMLSSLTDFIFVTYVLSLSLPLMLILPSFRLKWPEKNWRLSKVSPQGIMSTQSKLILFNSYQFN